MLKQEEFFYQNCVWLQHYLPTEIKVYLFVSIFLFITIKWEKKEMFFFSNHNSISLIMTS